MIRDRYSVHDDTLVIVPVFNEEKVIVRTINNLKKFFPNILVINDGSTDKTLFLIKKLHIKVISHLINLGQGASLDTGFKYFCKSDKYKYVITFDGDGQHSPNDALEMLLLAKRNKAEIVIASRFVSNKVRSKVPFFKKLILKLAIIYERIFYRIKLTDAHNGLRVISKNVVLNWVIPLEDFDMAHATEISYKLFKSGKKIIEFPASIKYMNLRSQTPLNAINLTIKSIFKIR